MIFENIRQDKKLKIPLSDDALRTSIFTPDASLTMALIANTPNAYIQTWHLPCDDNRLTYKALINLASKIYQSKFQYIVLKMWLFKIVSLFNNQSKELLELLPGYMVDNIFVSDKFKN